MFHPAHSKMPKLGKWNKEEDDLVEKWDKDPASTSYPLCYTSRDKTATVRLLSLSLVLRDTTPLVNPTKNPINNAKWNPINNSKCHDEVMTGKLALATLRDHSPPSEV